MAQKKKSLADFLMGLDPKTGDKPAPSVKNESDKQIAAALKAGEASGFDLSGIAGATGKQTEEVKAAEQAGYSPKDIAKTIFPKKAPETAAQKAKATQTAEQKAIEQQIQQTADNPWTKLGNALTSQYQSEMTPMIAEASGSTGAGAQAGAANQALASLGLSSGSSAGQWLASQTAAAQQTAAPVSAAMNNEAAQMQESLNPISAALANYAQANAQLIETAPQSGWLNALASHITWNLSYPGPATSEGSLTPSILTALQQSGGYGGTGGSGAIPVQSLSTKGGKVVSAPGGTGIGSVGSSPYGTVGVPTAPATSAAG